jgi:zinc transport system ATP-binding protein
MSKIILELKNVCFNYQGQSILDDINLRVFSNDFLAIIGPNGAGKSTLLKLILGTLSPYKGDVYSFGQGVRKGREHIGYLPQLRRFSINYPISVIDCVLMGVLNQNIFKRLSGDDFERAHAMLALVKADDLAEKQLGALSGGQLQRVLLARALMKSPQLLVLDEPTCSVDQPTGQHFFELMETLNKTMAIIMVSHDLMAVSHAAKTIACLNKTLTYHNNKELSQSDIESAYCCHVDLISHGIPHRVLGGHQHG